MAALATVAPEECLRFLADEGHDVPGMVSAPELSRALWKALDGFDGPPAPRRAYAASLAHRYSGMLDADAAGALVQALGPKPAPDDFPAIEALLNRFPSEPRLLSAALAAAQARNDAERADQLLTRLGLADRSPGTVAFVHRMRQPVSQLAGTSARIALVSSYTIDHLVAYVDLACRSIGIGPEFYVAPFNSWTREFIDETSGLRKFAPDIVFLSIAIDDLVPELSGMPEADSLDGAARSALERVLNAVRAFATWSAGTPLVVHDFHSAYPTPPGWLANLNAELAAALRDLPACYLLDVREAVNAGGASLEDNPKLRHIASMRLPPASLSSIAAAYARFIAPAKRMTKKCVVVDLDNTLWGGVVGEDSKEGIRLGHTAPGSEFVEFQEYLRSLPARGILLAINSKNNAADALDVIRNHEAMVLRENDFSAIRINWQPKPENMLAIAEELNIGVDSLVFVDDNPDERERMRQLLPDVLTVELPKDPALYRSVLERLPQLQTLAITAEDRARAQQYQTARLREETKLSAASVDEYLHSLQIEVAIAAAARPVFPRIAQLFARTNQFNTTTRRYDIAAVERFAADPAMRLWVLSSKDRFGDHGLVALALVRAGESAWEIDDFLMSCRVIGYGIEATLLAHIAGRARAAGAGELIGEFIETAKNAPAADLYAKHGFRRQASNGAGDVQRWQLDLNEPFPFPAWVKLDVHDA